MSFIFSLAMQSNKEVLILNLPQIHYASISFFPSQSCSPHQKPNISLIIYLMDVFIIVAWTTKHQCIRTPCLRGLFKHDISLPLKQFFTGYWLAYVPLTLLHVTTKSHAIQQLLLLPNITQRHKRFPQFGIFRYLQNFHYVIQIFRALSSMYEVY